MVEYESKKELWQVQVFVYMKNTFSSCIMAGSPSLLDLPVFFLVCQNSGKANQNVIPHKGQVSSVINSWSQLLPVGLSLVLTKASVLNLVLSATSKERSASRNSKF